MPSICRYVDTSRRRFLQSLISNHFFFQTCVCSWRESVFFFSHRLFIFTEFRRLCFLYSLSDCFSVGWKNYALAFNLCYYVLHFTVQPEVATAPHTQHSHHSLTNDRQHESQWPSKCGTEQWITLHRFLLSVLIPCPHDQALQTREAIRPHVENRSACGTGLLTYILVFWNQINVSSKYRVEGGGVTALIWVYCLIRSAVYCTCVFFGPCHWEESTLWPMDYPAYHSDRPATSHLIVGRSSKLTWTAADQTIKLNLSLGCPSWLNFHTVPLIFGHRVEYAEVSLYGVWVGHDSLLVLAKLAYVEPLSCVARTRVVGCIKRVFKMCCCEYTLCQSRPASSTFI